MHALCWNNALITGVLWGVLSQFITKENDNNIELYGVKMPKSKNYIVYIIIAVVLLILLIVAGLLIRKCVNSKNKRGDIIPIKETIDAVQLIPSEETIN